MLEGVQELGVEGLLLDPANPRLPKSVDTENPLSILEFLTVSSSITELISAIGSNGYFSSEPLIGLRQDDQSVVVVEGNRRLTALKLLRGATFDGIPRRVVDAVDQAEHRPELVPVAVYSERADILNYLGNKHIAGVKPWGALAKARYAKQLFQIADGDDYGAKVKNVAKAIGSRTDFIGRSLKALEAYETAETRNFFELAGVSEESVKFSLLGTALDYEGIQKFVYENPDDMPDRRRLNIPELTELFEWLFVRDDRGATRLGESRKIGMLSDVVASEEGLRSFRLGMPLDQAFRQTEGINDEFDQLTTRILTELRNANGLVADVEYSDFRADNVKSIFRQSRQLKNSLEASEDD